jgi:hypothetical protein
VKTELRYAREVTKHEIDLGFDVVERDSQPIVTARLDGGLRTVKIHLEDGAIAYAICDDALRPLYPHASSLEELATRFRVVR